MYYDKEEDTRADHLDRDITPEVVMCAIKYLKGNNQLAPKD